MFRGYIFLCWLPGVLETKSRRTHITLGTAVGGVACRSMMLLVPLSLRVSCHAAISHKSSAKYNKEQCCWLSMSTGSSGGTAVKSADLLVDTPLVWPCLLAVATVCCLGSSLCCLTVWQQV